MVILMDLARTFLLGCDLDTLLLVGLAHVDAGLELVVDLVEHGKLLHILVELGRTGRPLLLREHRRVARPPFALQKHEGWLLCEFLQLHRLPLFPYMSFLLLGQTLGAFLPLGNILHCLELRVRLASADSYVEVC